MTHVTAGAPVATVFESVLYWPSKLDEIAGKSVARFRHRTSANADLTWDPFLACHDSTKDSSY